MHYRGMASAGSSAEMCSEAVKLGGRSKWEWPCPADHLPVKVWAKGAAMIFALGKYNNVHRWCCVVKSQLVCVERSGPTSVTIAPRGAQSGTWVAPFTPTGVLDSAHTYDYRKYTTNATIVRTVLPTNGAHLSVLKGQRVAVIGTPVWCTDRSTTVVPVVLVNPVLPGEFYGFVASSVLSTTASPSTTSPTWSTAAGYATHDLGHSTVRPLPPCRHSIANGVASRYVDGVMSAVNITTGRPLRRCMAARGAFAALDIPTEIEAIKQWAACNWWARPVYTLACTVLGKHPFVGVYPVLFTGTALVFATPKSSCSIPVEYVHMRDDGGIELHADQHRVCNTHRLFRPNPANDALIHGPFAEKSRTPSAYMCKCPY